MGNPLLVISPSVVTCEPSPSNIKVGDFVIDRKCTAKNWRKKIGKVIWVTQPGWYNYRMTLRMADGRTVFDAHIYRYLPIEVYKARLDKHMRRQNEILSRLYGHQQTIAKMEVEAPEVFKKLGV